MHANHISGPMPEPRTRSMVPKDSAQTQGTRERGAKRGMGTRSPGHYDSTTSSISRE